MKDHLGGVVRDFANGSNAAYTRDLTNVTFNAVLGPKDKNTLSREDIATDVQINTVNCNEEDELLSDQNPLHKVCCPLNPLENEYQDQFDR